MRRGEEGAGDADITAAEENVLEMLILLAQQIEEEENRNWNLLLLDIFALIFVM